MRWEGDPREVILITEMRPITLNRKLFVANHLQATINRRANKQKAQNLIVNGFFARPQGIISNNNMPRESSVAEGSPSAH